MARIIKYYFAGAASTAAEVMKVDTGKTGIIDKATRASYHQDGSFIMTASLAVTSLATEAAFGIYLFLWA